MQTFKSDGDPSNHNDPSNYRSTKNQITEI